MGLRAVLCESDPVLDLFACLVDSRWRDKRAGWLDDFLWPTYRDGTEALQEIIGAEGVPQYEVAYLDKAGDDGGDRDKVLITESVTVDRGLAARFPQLEKVIQFGRFEPSRISAELHSGIDFMQFERSSIRSVAEHAVTLMLALLREVCTVSELTKTQAPPREPTEYAYNWLDCSTRLLCERTVGIFGFGQVGQAVARALGGLRPQRIIYWARRPVAGNAGMPVRHVGNLLSALRLADIAVICLPLTPETRALIGGRELGELGSDALLVNVARGAIVDEDALVGCLNEGRLGGAALDVFSREPVPAGNPLRASPRTLLTPHHAGADRRVLLRELARLALCVVEK